MKNAVAYVAFATLCFLLISSVSAGSYPDPVRYEKAVSSFEKNDAEKLPPPGSVLCIGSSSMRMWHPTIEEDLAPLTVIPRGFGGSTMKDLLYFADRIIIPYKPRAILVYEGDNDSAAGVSSETFKEVFDALISKIHTALPETRIYLLSVKPSPSRIKLMPLMKKYNAVMKEAADKDSLITYIDVFNPMLDESGQPLKNIFKSDNLHMNRDGYLLWKKTIQPVLVETEKKYER